MKIDQCVRPRPWRGEAYHCLFYAHNPHLICCAVHPYGIDSERCPDFQPDSNAEEEELWAPVGWRFEGDELVPNHAES